MNKYTYLKLKRQKRKARLLAIFTLLSLFISIIKDNKVNAATNDNEKTKEQILELILEKTIPNYTSKVTTNEENNIATLHTYNPYSNKNNTDIAHRGYAAKENSAEAFRLAGEKGFWGCEADVRFDSEGNLVCSHETVRKGDTPTTFKEYLEICKEFGMIAIIDLKYEKGVGFFDEDLSPSILDVINKMGMIDKCVLQTNNSVDIPYIRKTQEDARIWYLTNDLSDNNIKLIKENNVECVDLKSNDYTKEQIKKLNEIGVKSSVWNVFTLKEKERLIKSGATYIMSDNLLRISKEENNNLKFDNTITPSQIIYPPGFEDCFNNSNLKK